MKKIHLFLTKNSIIKIRQSITGLSLIMICFFLAIALSGMTIAYQDLDQAADELQNADYSDFQRRMILNSAQEAINEGISPDDANSILTGSIKNNLDAYNVMKIFNLVVDAKKQGISEKDLINKVKEGLAKNVEERLIIAVVNQESEHMKAALKLLQDNQITNGNQQEMVSLIADSLNNGVPTRTLEEILKISKEQGRSWTQIEKISTQLGDLGLKATELGINREQVEKIFFTAVESQEHLDEICGNIQDMMIAAVAVKTNEAKAERDDQGKENATASPSTLPDIPLPSPDEESGTHSGMTPSEESGTSPVESDENTGDTPEDETGTPPEN